MPSQTLRPAAEAARTESGQPTSRCCRERVRRPRLFRGLRTTGSRVMPAIAERLTCRRIPSRGDQNPFRNHRGRQWPMLGIRPNSASSTTHDRALRLSPDEVRPWLRSVTGSSTLPEQNPQSVLLFVHNVRSTKLRVEVSEGPRPSRAAGCSRRCSREHPMAILTDTRHLHPREAVQALTQAVVEACGGELRDDATVLCVDWHGGPTGERDASSGADR